MQTTSSDSGQWNLHNSYTEHVPLNTVLTKGYECFFVTKNTCRIQFLFNNLDPDPIFLMRYEELSTIFIVISGLSMASNFALKMEGRKGLTLKIIFLLKFIYLRIV